MGIMGSCILSPPSKSIDQRISTELKASHRERLCYWRRSGVFRTFLCGTESSGKTTIYRQIQRLGGEELIEWNDHYLKDVRRKCIDTIIYLLALVHDTESSKQLESLSIDRARDLEKLGNIIENVWTKYNGFQRILFYSFAYKDEFDFNPNTAYFMENIQRIMSNQTNPVLNDEDVIHFRANCPRIEHGMSRFLSKKDTPYTCRLGATSVIIDMQSDIWHSKARHWYLLDDSCLYEDRTRPPFFESIIFVAALSDYCETVPGHPTVNALQHSIDECASIMNAAWHQEKVRLLLLNKQDIFQQRIRAGISLSVCFGDEWEGPDFPNSQRNEDIRCVTDGWRRKMEIVLRRFIPNVIADTVYEYAREKEMASHSTADPYDEAMHFVYRKFIEKVHVDDDFHCNVISATDHDLVCKVMWDLGNWMTNLNRLWAGLV